eukprot:55364-Pelagomonas_calceolata.AAC.2
MGKSRRGAKHKVHLIVVDQLAQQGLMSLGLTAVIVPAQQRSKESWVTQLHSVGLTSIMATHGLRASCLWGSQPSLYLHRAEDSLGETAALNSYK